MRRPAMSGEAETPRADMSNQDRLFLLTGRSTSRHQSVYSGISLTDERNDVKDGEIWNAWILSNPAVAVSLVTHHVTVSHLSTSEGSAWECDGIITMVSSEDRPNPARPRLNEVNGL